MRFYFPDSQDQIDPSFDFETEELSAFFFTDHYRDYPAVLVRLPAVTAERLKPYLERSWRLRAPKRLQWEADAS